MLIILAASRAPSLKGLVPESVALAGKNLVRLFDRWQETLGCPSSPSYDQCVRIISEADRSIQNFRLSPESPLD